MKRLPRRRLVGWTPDDGDGDAWLAKQAELGWTPDDGDGDAWLAKQAELGWVPEHRTGSDTIVNGKRVRRFAMIYRPMSKDAPEP